MKKNKAHRLVLFAWLALPACRLSDSSSADRPGLIPAKPEGENAQQLAAREARRLEALKEGKRLYRRACATCHGASGDGFGPSARALDPRPRDFTKGAFKWRSTASGLLPLDGDLYWTISRGIPGTRMPAWKDLLTEEERWSLVEAVKSFSSRFQEEPIEEEDIVKIPEAPPATPESIAQGQQLFEKFKCWECHGRSGRGDGPSAATLKDSWGVPIKPFDFTTGGYRCGGADSDIYRTFFTGLNGTPMPSFAETIPEADRWPLVHYVRSLQRTPGLLERIVFDNP